MLQNQPRTTSLFRMSLRTWQANYKARQQVQATADEPAEASAPPAQASKPRVKRLAARKRRRAMAAQA
jgi:hypothetical protein